MFERSTFLGVTVAALLITGCASVPMESQDAAARAKAFAPPSAGQAGLYVYRGSGPGGALKKDIWIDGRCLGESAPKVFFYQEVPGDREHTISTESEFSPNDLKLMTASGQLYFIEQYIKIGVFVGGANVRVVDPDKGKQAVQKLGLAAKGTCAK